MSARREIEQHRQSLGEIREVMHSMRTLAYMETRKLTRFLDIQQQQVADIETMAADLLFHYPEVRPATVPAHHGLILIGSERGFCGDFNEHIAHALQSSETLDKADTILAVGHRLNTRLDANAARITGLDGASATEQVASVLSALTATIATVQQTHGPLALSVLYHENEGDELRERVLFPPFEALAAAPRAGHPPCLQLAPSTLFAMLLDHYLFALLSEVLYTSLMAENQRRIQHLDSALRHLDERREELARRSRAMRQEEITEEIELILLNVEAPGTAHRPGRDRQA